MLAINVSIPNVTVARLEQFRSLQLRVQREQPTDVEIDLKQTVLCTKSIAVSLSPVTVHLELM